MDKLEPTEEMTNDKFASKCNPLKMSVRCIRKIDELVDEFIKMREIIKNQRERLEAIELRIKNIEEVCNG